MVSNVMVMLIIAIFLGLILRLIKNFINPPKKGVYLILNTETVIPRSDNDFNRRQSIIADYVSANADRWGLDRNWILNTFNPARERWNAAWANCQDVLQRTKLITFEKNQARKNYEPLLRRMVKILEVSTLVTDEERANMGIFPAKQGKPVDVPTTFPDIFVKSGTIRELIIDFRDHESTSWGKPKGVHGGEIRWGILDHLPTDVDELTHSEFDTRSPFTLTFKEAERGLTVWICMRWENTRGVKGPWSEFASAIIP